MGEAQSPASLKTRLVLPLSLLVGVVAVGTIGYRWLWSAIGGTWLDALFMTFTTITTIGYGEVKPLDSAGRLFTIAVALAGIGAFFAGINPASAARPTYFVTVRGEMRAGTGTGSPLT